MGRRIIQNIIILITLVFMCFELSTPAIGKSTGSLYIGSNPSKIPGLAKNRTDTLIVGTNLWNSEFNPVFSFTMYDGWATSLIFDTFGLMGNDDSGSPKLWMAKDYSISKDGKTYVFHINKGIKYSNGDTVTAEDFALAYTAIADPSYNGIKTDMVENLVGYDGYHKGYAKTLAGIKVVDEYTIQFIEKTVKASALLQDFVCQPLDHKIYAFQKGKVGELRKLYEKAVGAGPYKLVENKPGQSITFVKNENYWRGVPKINRVIMKYVTNDNEIDELATGNVDIDGRLQCKPRNIELLTSAEFIDLYINPANQYGYIGLNLRDFKFKDKRVRQALAYGLNRKAFVDSFYKEYAQVCNTPIPEVSWAYTDKVNQYEYNPKKAADLLDAAGWKLASDGYRYKNGKRFTINWMTYTGSEYINALIPVVKDSWRLIGVEVNPQLMEFSTLSDKIFKERNFDMYNMSWVLNIDPDPSGIFSISQDIPGGSNSVGFRNAESEQLIRSGLNETDQKKRAAIYKQWCQLINDELPYIFLNQGNTLYAVSARVKGFQTGTYRDWTFDIQNLELRK